MRASHSSRPSHCRVALQQSLPSSSLAAVQAPATSPPAAKMIPLFKTFAGGPLGSGKQWFSWIHLDDLVSLIYEALRNPSYKGIINGTAPHPVRLSEMCDQLGQVMGRPSWLPVPEFVLKAVLGEGASIVLQGQKVLPVKAKELGFTYKYPFIKDALRDIISSGST